MNKWFYRGQFTEIVKKKSSENYDGSPYVTSLLSCCLWTFYGVLDPDDGVLVISVSAIGVVSQVIYLALLLLYYPRDKKVSFKLRNQYQKYIRFFRLTFWGIHYNFIMNLSTVNTLLELQIMNYELKLKRSNEKLQTR